jgi:hypothetical protein
MLEAAPIAVVETPEFLSATRELMTEEERALLVDYPGPQSDGRGPRPGNRRRAQVAMGTGGAWKARRGTRGLFLPQHRYSAVRAYGLRQERASGFEPEGSE